MALAFDIINERKLLSPYQQSYFLSPPPPINLQSNGFNWSSKVSPSILLVIIILAIIFFVSGLLHLLVRFLLRPINRDPDEMDNLTALQGQLQQLFHLHDAGVDQSFIDTLPVFNYKAIIGVKNPFDCAVCLCEFEAEDKLRLLPKCSHAFHMDCIDTWLLSHSTCPLCRASLLPEFSPNSSFSPVVHVLESGSESSREVVQDRDGVIGNTNQVARANSHLRVHFEDGFGISQGDLSHKSCEIQAKEEENQEKTEVAGEEKVVTVKLGKYKNVDGGGGGGEGSSNNNVDARRCYSMGSFAYVMDDNSSLRVPIRTPLKKQPSRKPSLPLTPGHRPAISLCDCDSTREFNGFKAFKSIDIQSGSGIVGNIPDGNVTSAVGKGKRESFSVSNIWLRGKKEKPSSAVGETSRRAFSLRFPVHRNAVAGDDVNAKNGGNGDINRRTISEIDMRRWENMGRQLGCDEDVQSCNSLDSQANPPSFARKTLLWLMGRQNKVVNSSSAPNV